IIMKLVIIGGTGLIGSKLVTGLREQGHEAVPASPETGVNILTGQGLAEALQGASVVVDVSNSPSFEDKAVMEFFTTSTRNLLKYAAAAGVRHYVALSVVGTGRIPDSPYLRAKNAQETLISWSHEFSWLRDRATRVGSPLEKATALLGQWARRVQACHDAHARRPCGRGGAQFNV